MTENRQIIRLHINLYQRMWLKEISSQMTKNCLEFKLYKMMKTTNPTTQINRRPNTQNKYQDCKNNSTVNKSNKKPKHNNITIA